MRWPASAPGSTVWQPSSAAKFGYTQVGYALGMVAIDPIANPWGVRTPYASGESWSQRVDSYLADGISPESVDRWVQSAAVLHSNGDGLDIAVKDGRMVGVRGRAVDRVNRGRLDPKDMFGWQANASRDRLTSPLLRKRGRLRPCDWDTAMDRVVKRSRELLDTHGPSAIGFYTSGQLFAEEYYTQAVIARGGIGTNHLDGNTRLCTATAAAALKESFGCDGQPGSYTDVDHADVIALFGHNVAETQTVLWARMLDRLAGPSPPAIVCVDPRPTPVARQATVHLAPLPGTNVALMNGLLHEIIAHDWVDHDYIDAHTVGFDELRKRVAEYPPERVAEISRVHADDIRRAARVIGNANRLLSTVLQGFYQSHQATAAAVQVNNIHLIRGMLGKPGSGVLQMNGQPTAENTRECGADGDLPGFRNWANDGHVADLARVWNVEPQQIPHYGPPTHAMQMFRFAEEGTLQMLWVTATNPAVSLPELARIRRILSQDRLFLVVQVHLHDRDRRAGRRGVARRGMGREDRHLHQRRSHRAPVRKGCRTTGIRAPRPRYLSRLCAANGLPGQGRGATIAVDGCGVSVRSVEEVQCGPAV